MYISVYDIYTCIYTLTSLANNRLTELTLKPRGPSACPLLTLFTHVLCSLRSLQSTSSASSSIPR